MEALLASAVGVMTAAGVYLILRLRAFPVIVGLAMLSYAVNVFLALTGRIAIDAPPILRDGVERYADPLPQALVLTAIVISFGMTAVVVMLALGAHLSSGDDRVSLNDTDSEDGAEERR